MTDEQKCFVKMKIGPGINKNIHEVIKQEVSQWTTEQKYCSIVFSKFELKPNVEFNEELDMIIGYVSVPGGEQTKEIADHALVFMIHGSVYQWTKHFAVYFCQKSIPKECLKGIIEEVVEAVVETSLIPLALVTTQSACIQRAIKELQKDDVMANIKGTRLNVIYDPRHLLLGIRNHFAQKGKVLFNKKIAQYQDIVTIYQVERGIIALNPTKAGRGWFYNLADEDILPEKLDKTKVKPCIKIFSTCMAGLLYIMGNGMQSNMDHTTMRNTSKLIEFFDKLFDSVNGENNPVISPLVGIEFTKPLRTAVSRQTPHKTFWREAEKSLKTMKFIDEDGNESRPATITNWCTTIRSFQNICAYLHNRSVEFVTPRWFTTDPVENFVKKIEEKYVNEDITCNKFLKTFKEFYVEMPNLDIPEDVLSEESEGDLSDSDSDSESDGSDDGDEDIWGDFENYMRTNFPHVDFEKMFQGN